MSKRPTITGARRLRIFQANDGTCHLCGRKIAIGEPWHAEHVRARGFKGPDTDDNLKPAHIDCHAGKTKVERKSMAKADAVGKKHIGEKKRPKRPAWRAPLSDGHVTKVKSGHQAWLDRMKAKGKLVVRRPASAEAQER